MNELNIETFCPERRIDPFSGPHSIFSGLHTKYGKFYPQGKLIN